MISKELVGTSERLEQIKNKLSSSAACPDNKRNDHGYP